VVFDDFGIQKLECEFFPRGLGALESFGGRVGVACVGVVFTGTPGPNEWKRNVSGSAFGRPHNSCRLLVASYCISKLGWRLL
jgi:hypothetical protein